MIRLLPCLVLLAALLAGRALAANKEALAFDDRSVGPPGSGAAMELSRPAGQGPFPAIVVLHGCQGVGEGSRDWAARLAAWGYVVAVVDSLGPRRFKEICDTGWLVPPQLRAADAANAAAYLRTRPDVAGDRIGVIGFSHGGSSVLAAAIANPTPFRAAVAYYPSCATSRIQGFTTDTLILIGADDDWNPAANCTALVAALATAEHPPAFKVYPGAAHGFDVAGLDRLSANGHVLRGNAEAASDSFELTRAFLAARLAAR